MRFFTVARGGFWSSFKLTDYRHEKKKRDVVASEIMALQGGTAAFHKFVSIHGRIGPPTADSVMSTQTETIDINGRIQSHLRKYQAGIGPRKKRFHGWKPRHSAWDDWNYIAPMSGTLSYCNSS